MFVHRRLGSFLIVASLAIPSASLAQSSEGVLTPGPEIDLSKLLPPELPWNGKSRSLLVPSNDPWVTPFELSGGARTPRYDETVAWLRKLADASPQIEMVSLGKSPEGRDLWLVIASAEGAKTPEALHAAGKPVLYAQAGIHAGEIDGKDAGLMFLRDLTARGTKKDLLAKASFLFLPIFNVDGHERFSPYGRINQRGPEACGWRTTSANFNLNRDYAKLDTPEMRCVIEALQAWAPDLCLDLHVTDGHDQQYDVTWSYNGPYAWSPNQAAWLDAVLNPALTRDLRAMGHIPGPYVWLLKDGDPSGGVRFGTSGIRYSDGYGDARHVATVLVETHSLKPYPQRVLGTYVLLESALRALGQHGKELEQAAAADRKLRPRELALDWTDAKPEPKPMEFLAVASVRSPSPVSGGLRQEWTGRPVTLQVSKIVQSQPSVTAARPRAYWIPAEWIDVIDRLERHGVRMERQTDGRELEVTAYRIQDPKLAATPFEGHVAVQGKPVPEKRTMWFPPGSVRVPTDQPLGDLAMLLLEPGSPDSFFQWGFFLSILQPAEYVEPYVMEPLAAEMLARSPTLAAAFEKKLLEDPAFAGDAKARLAWFYRQTPYADDRWNLYPVAREE